MTTKKKVTDPPKTFKAMALEFVQQNCGPMGLTLWALTIGSAIYNAAGWYEQENYVFSIAAIAMEVWTARLCLKLLNDNKPLGYSFSVAGFGFQLPRIPLVILAGLIAANLYSGSQTQACDQAKHQAAIDVPYMKALIAFNQDMGSYRVALKALQDQQSEIQRQLSSPQLLRIYPDAQREASKLEQRERLQKQQTQIQQQQAALKMPTEPAKPKPVDQTIEKKTFVFRLFIEILKGILPAIAWGKQVVSEASKPAAPITVKEAASIVAKSRYAKKPAKRGGKQTAKKEAAKPSTQIRETNRKSRVKSDESNPRIVHLLPPENRPPLRQEVLAQYK